MSLIARGVAGLLSPAGSRARLSILIYHRVLERRDPVFPDEVDAQSFERQMRWLASQFRVLPLRDAAARLARGDLPARAACITFDDGYADNEAVALPILRRLGLHATFFVASGFLDGGMMFNDRVIESVRAARADRLDLSDAGLGAHDLANPAARRRAIDALLGAVKYLPQPQRDEKVALIARACGAQQLPQLMMRADQVRALHAAGMDIGGHTATHPILSRLEPGDARREIATGKSRLEAIIDAPVRLFAYPNGKPHTDYAAEHVTMVRELGFDAAVCTAWGVADRAADRYQLPRFTPWDRQRGRFALRMAQNLLRTRPQLA